MRLTATAWVLSAFLFLGAAPPAAAAQTPPAPPRPAPPSPPPPEEEEHEHEEHEEEEHVHEGAEVLVSVTRGDRRIEDEPLRVEVIGEEEIGEKMMMRPGTIAMLLSETAGLRVQESAPAVGGASVRIQGLRGRYSRILVDGLPLYGGQSGALALLQIPPMDLRQVEVIKGAASALYGSSALGGVVNLVSRRPGEGERELLLNATHRGGSDALFWASDALSGGWGYTALAGFHDQPRTDVAGDGWADIPGFRRGTVRPRLFFDDGRGQRARVTLGGMVEERSGGGTPPGSGVEVPQALDSRRVDGGLTWARLLEGGRYLDIRASGSRTAHRHRPVNLEDEDVHGTAAGEVSLRGGGGRHNWVVGVAVELERYRSDEAPVFDFDHWVPSIFVQDEVRLSEAATLALSARADRHSTYGGFVSPRASLLLRSGEHTTLRLSGGTGYHAPTPFTEETEEAGLRRVAPLQDMKAERARTASADLGWAGEWLQANATLFGSRVHDAVAALPDGSGGLRLANIPGTTATWGTEFLVRVEREPLVATVFHTHIHAREPDPESDGVERRAVPLTPRDQVGMVVALEEHGEYRFGVEAYYVGPQSLDDNPFRVRSRSYWMMGIQGERRFGRVRAFLNLENLTDTRQTRWDPLLRTTPNAWGRWTTEVWAPLEGRTINGGVRIAF
jgi:outer membrane receptor for ferrienterochelin and colicins